MMRQRYLFACVSIRMRKGPVWIQEKMGSARRRRARSTIFFGCFGELPAVHLWCSNIVSARTEWRALPVNVSCFETRPLPALPRRYLAALPSISATPRLDSCVPGFL